MKKPAKFVLGALSAMVAAGALIAAGPAVAAGPAASQTHTYSAANGDTPPAELIGPNGEKPVEWGIATFDPNSGSPALESVGGGTWHHGTVADGGYKGCYSNYIHPKKKHSASVAIADKTDRDVKDRDIWAKAYATSGWAYKCSAYWGVY
ncbi:lactococcin 972 family bacteriocin [Streptomyces vinaceus]|uniref:lactococcin 972 family bacteriocin n=1 Tax=Streptomyces vinaceus TaxID=1960 RepID=UPI0035D7C988